MAYILRSMLPNTAVSFSPRHTRPKALGKYDSVQAGYAGTLSRHLDVQGYNNVPSQLAAPGANQYEYIPFPDFSPGSAYEATNGPSNYNSLQAVYSRSVEHGLSILANYTYSKCMSNAAEFGRSLGYRAQFLRLRHWWRQRTLRRRRHAPGSCPANEGSLRTNSSSR